MTEQRTFTLTRGTIYRHRLEFYDAEADVPGAQPVDATVLLPIVAYLGPKDGGPAIAAFEVDDSAAADGIVDLELDCTTILDGKVGPLRVQVWPSIDGELVDPLLDGPAYIRSQITAPPP